MRRTEHNLRTGRVGSRRHPCLIGSVAFVGLLIFTGGSTAYASTAATSTSTNATAPLPPPSHPDNCFSGYFCSYNGTNGSGLCFQTTASVNFPPGCENMNNSVYNNDPNNIAYLSYLEDYQGAYYTLYPGHYLLYMSKNTFNQCPGGGTSCAGYGQPMNDNVESVAIYPG